MTKLLFGSITLTCRLDTDKSQSRKDTFQLGNILVFAFHSFNNHRRYINVDNICVTAINHHAFAEGCKHHKIVFLFQRNVIFLESKERGMYP